jgi:hypothetical protein
MNNELEVSINVKGPSSVTSALNLLVLIYLLHVSDTGHHHKCTSASA